MSLSLSGTRFPLAVGCAAEARIRESRPGLPAKTEGVDTRPPALANQTRSQRRTGRSGTLSLFYPPARFHAFGVWSFYQPFSQWKRTLRSPGDSRFVDDHLFPY
jgi:hypothetical protein